VKWITFVKVEHIVLQTQADALHSYNMEALVLKTISTHWFVVWMHSAMALLAVHITNNRRETHVLIGGPQNVLKDFHAMAKSVLQEKQLIKLQNAQKTQNALQQLFLLIFASATVLESVFAIPISLTSSLQVFVLNRR